jgi:hypothetical protein
LRYIDLFDWLLWIHDDAYFTNLGIDLEGVIAMADGTGLVICASPSTKTIFTKFSSGQFQLKPTPLARSFLEEVLMTDMPIVKALWRDNLGYCTGSDQESMVYHHSKRNNSDFEYESLLHEHFLVHVTGTRKQQSYREFYQRLGANPWLLPEEAIREYGLSPEEA